MTGAPEGTKGVLSLTTPTAATDALRFAAVAAFSKMMTTILDITIEAPRILNGLMASSGSAIACRQGDGMEVLGYL